MEQLRIQMLGIAKGVMILVPTSVLQSQVRNKPTFSTKAREEILSSLVNFFWQLKWVKGFPSGSVTKNLPANTGNTGLISWSGKILHTATRPVCYNYWVCALEPMSCSYWAHELKPECLEPMLHNKRSHCKEKLPCLN